MKTHETDTYALLHGDCLERMKEIPDGCVDTVITSPPYNLNVKRKNGDMYNKKYEGYRDERSNDEYIKWQLAILKECVRILVPNGKILYNINYGGENNETMWLLLGDIIQKTDLTIADQLIWKKRNAIPMNGSRNKVTRICENIFVLCRKSEYQTFTSNKKVKSITERTGQKWYENVWNFIEAPNNDKGEHTKTHKATYSVGLCVQLMQMYCTEGQVILDPFMGSGTTGIACSQLGHSFIGIELSEKYFEIAKERIENA